MGYDSLSTIIVLVIVLMGIAVWLPARTRKGMKWTQEHRADKYSTSLHLVDEHSGTRFSDGDTRMEGIVMQSNVGHISAQRVAEVRRLRHEAIRRRRFIAISLAVITVLVLVCAFVFHFSPWFALIPAVLLGAVLALGARAAKHAREWERKVALDAKRSAAAAVPSGAKPAAIERGEQRPVAAREKKPAAHTPEEPDTEVMEQREIHTALRKAQIEKREAFERRGKVEQASEPSEADAQSSVSSVSSVSSSSPSPATPDAAASPEQDLISFSLGSSDSEAAAPESLEIKSTRQVAKAEPVDTVEHEMLSAEAKVETEPGDPAEVEAFHLTERQAEVTAPAATSDSLGIGLEAILTRRKA
ncbi:hypothetical protein [Bifidobacterium panos]|uniref:Magnesium transporter n=1 Tax=Bifidobacterium panos TaxID=2675321 RepID=A0ABX1T093_9BIFI|nr:hypothetical protein [Bifidobacterium sp. DSM 109963]NMN02078.1 hypothetical protein [Bifidobacterium sp. DSM 109963]